MRLTTLQSTGTSISWKIHMASQELDQTTVSQNASDGVTCRVILDSVAGRHRLTTLLCEYPLFIHAEVLTHRQFSRNSSSARAIPGEAYRKRCTAKPIYWGSEQKGMKAGAELSGYALPHAKSIWDAAKHDAFSRHQQLLDLGVHKQIANRLLAPFYTMTTLITATEWSNFYAQRRHPGAQPEIKHLADRMFEAMEESIPLERLWHLPFVDGYDNLTGLIGIRASVARCARTSYLTHEGKRNVERDLELYEKLRWAEPPHWSTFEHIGHAGGNGGNLKGWTSARQEMGG